jgi:hypothetical protein
MHVVSTSYYVYVTKTHPITATKETKRPSVALRPGLYAGASTVLKSCGPMMFPAEDPASARKTVKSVRQNKAGCPYCKHS